MTIIFLSYQVPDVTLVGGVGLVPGAGHGGVSVVCGDDTRHLQVVVCVPGGGDGVPGAPHLVLLPAPVLRPGQLLLQVPS